MSPGASRDPPEIVIRYPTMERPPTFYLGITITVIALLCRVGGRSLAESFTLPNIFDLDAWNVVFDVGMYAGVTLTLLGWFMPPSGNGPQQRGFPISPIEGEQKVG
jgi:hypothetical protein